jgi:hypothetical protein
VCSELDSVDVCKIVFGYNAGEALHIQAEVFVNVASKTYLVAIVKF